MVQLFRPWLGQGIKFPFEVDRFGRIALANDIDLVNQSLSIIFSTSLGSEFYREHEGSQLKEVMFEPNDQVVMGLLDYIVNDAIAKWEGRVRLADIRYDFPNNRPELINIYVFYTLRQSNEVKSFVFPFYRELKN